MKRAPRKPRKQVKRPPDPTPDLLRAHIHAAHLSISVYAREVVLRERRTVQRWLDGTHPIPKAVRIFLEAWQSEQET